MKIKNKKTKSIATFLIALVISMPIYSSYVIAALSNPHIYGADNVEGYLRKGETALINVTAKIIGDMQISPSQIHFIDCYNPETFTNCVDIGNEFFLCQHLVSPPELNQFQLKVSLCNDDNVQDSSITLYGIYDEQPPEIKSFSITPSSSKGGDIALHYSVYDHSYSPTDMNKCAGIKKIELSSPDKGIFRNITFNTFPNDCSRASSITIPVIDIANNEGNIPITLIAYDNFDQVSTKVIYLKYDTQVPIIDLNSLEIKDTKGNSIDYIGNNPVNGVVSFKIEGDDLDTNKVYGSFPEINTDNPSAYENRKATCNSIGLSRYKCLFDNIQVKLTQTTTVNVRVNASDLTGNLASSTLTKNIVFDNTGPSVLSIRTGKVDNGVSYVGNSNNFTVEFNEEGIGLNESQVKLDLSSIKAGLNNKAADSCTGSGNAWTCSWYNINSDQPDGTKTISVLSSSSDKLGNLVTGTLTGSVTIDRTNPVVISSDISALGTGIEALQGYIKTTDRVKISSRIKELNSLRGYADVSPIITTQGNIAGECVKGTNEWKCEFISEPIDVPGYIKTSIPLTFVDVAGNNIAHKQGITVYNYSDEKNPNYWTHAITCSPKLVDRQVTSLVEFRIMCSVELMPLTADQETISINLEHCQDNIQGSTAYIKDLKLINNQRGSTNPYLSIALSKTEIRADKISMICPLNIITKAGNNIMQNPESENVTVNIGLYNMPLGEYSKEIHEKIEKIKDDTFVGFKWIDTLKKILFYSEKICNVLGLLNKIQVFFGLLEQVPTIGDSVHSLSVGIEKLVSVKDGILYKFCAYISCDETLWGNWYNGQQSLWAGDIKKGTSPRTSGRGAAQGGGREVGGYENWLRKYDVGTMWPSSPKESLILSTLTGCLPGIIYGIDKWRQIQCNYGVCLIDSAENNIPIKVCEDQKSYLECKFLMGEIVQLLPLYWMRELGSYIAYILSDPLALVFGFIGFFCPSTPAKIHGRCAFLRGLTVFLDIVGDIQNMIEAKSWKIQNDMCEVFFDIVDELKEKGEKD